jgi:hypothetical protein
MNQKKDNNSTQIWIALIIVLIGMGLVFLLRDDSVKWSETYQHTTSKANKNPFDLSILRASLETDKCPVQDLTNKLAFSLPKEGEQENYLFVGEAMRLDSNDAKALRSFIERGNNAFIASKYISQRLLKHLTAQDSLAQTITIPSFESEDSEDSEENDSLLAQKERIRSLMSKGNDGFETIIDSHFVSRVYFRDTLKYKTGYYRAVGTAYLGLELLHYQYLVEHKTLKNAAVLGDLQGKYANFLAIPYGKGKLFIHANPIFFANIEIIDPLGKNHVERLLAHLPTGKTYWDKFSQTDVNTARILDSDYQDKEKEKAQNNILKYVVGHRSLAAAWYLLLSIGFLFVTFGAKRRQRIIPVLQRKVNTSLEYIQALGHLFFKQQDHTGLSNMKFKHFLAYIRQRYGLSTNQLDQYFITRLSQKSGVAENIIKSLIEKATYAERLPVEEEFLISFHQDLERFYKMCK